MQNTVIAFDRQSLLDIAMQEAGTAEAVFLLALANGMSVTDELTVGQLLKKTDIIDSSVVAMFKKENRHPATGINLLEMLAGIGYWIVGDDNIVQ